MDMRPLIIGNEQKLLIRQALELARQRPIPLEVLKPLASRHPKHRVLKLKDRPRGFRPQSEFVEIPLGFQAAISFEEQPSGLFAHLSVSIDERDKVPNPYAVAAIAKEFGLSGELPPKVGTVWMEEFGPGRTAINVLEAVLVSNLT